MKIKKILAVFMLMVLSVSFVSAGFSRNTYADTERGIFSKSEEIVNFGLELMDMEDPLPFEIYKTLRQINTQTEGLRLDLDPPIVYEGYSQAELDEKMDEMSTRASRAVQIAIDAFKMDYPEIFWLDISSTSYTATATVATYPGGRIVYTINGIKVNIGKEQGLGELDEAYDAVYEKLTACVNSTADLSVPEKLKVFHDYLCENFEYDLEAENGHNIYGALINGRCVCEGYAENFKALCDLAGIPCVLVTGKTSTTGENHMWNYCLLDDNKWYAVDATWDDQSEIINDFFLSGSETVSGITGNKFRESHLQNGDFSLTGIYEFTYPELSKEGYFKADPKPPVVDAEPGDVDGNGIIDAIDALTVLKVAAQLESIDEYASARADVDKNGSIDANDALQILKMAAQLIDSFAEAD